MAFLTVEQTAKKYPIYSVSALRHLIYRSKENGFSSVLRRIGPRKIVICEKDFLEWIDSHKF